MTADKMATHESASVFINDDERGLHADFDGMRKKRVLVKIIGE